MSLFCSTCKFSIYSLQSERQFSIQRNLAKTYSTSGIQTANCSKVSNFTGLGLFNLNPSLQNTQCCCMSSSSNPSVETSSISETEIFVKGKMFSSLMDNFWFYLQLMKNNIYFAKGYWIVSPISISCFQVMVDWTDDDSIYMYI